MRRDFFAAASLGLISLEFRLEEGISRKDGTKEGTNEGRRKRKRREKRQARKKYARAVSLLPLGTTLLFRRESEGLLLLGTEVWHKVNWTYKVFDSRAGFA